MILRFDCLSILRSYVFFDRFFAVLSCFSSAARETIIMLNPDFSIFDDNMFVQLRAAIDDITPPAGLPVLNLTIGDPQLPAPDLLTTTIAAHDDKWHCYPKADGDPDFRDDVHYYLGYRYGDKVAKMVDPDCHIVPVVGTREPLHLLGQMVRGAKPNSAALLPNPFYHAWRAGALGAGGDIIMLDASEKTGYLPDLATLDEDLLARTTVFYICSPTNPHGVFAPADYLRQLILLARQYNFLLLSDECYSDVWRQNPPVGALEVAADIGDGLSNLVVLNSLSKRSNAAGLRAGFLAGDAEAITLYKKMVANGAALLPTPLLRAAGALYRDKDHAEAIRVHYEESFAIAKRYLPSFIDESEAKGGFFLWLSVGDDVAFARRAYQEQALRVMPGRFMALEGQNGNPGVGFVRVALVHPHEVIEQAMGRLSTLCESESNANS